MLGEVFNIEFKRDCHLGLGAGLCLLGGHSTDYSFSKSLGSEKTYLPNCSPLFVDKMPLLFLLQLSLAQLRVHVTQNSTHTGQERDLGSRLRGNKLGLPPASHQVHPVSCKIPKNRAYFPLLK